MSDVQVIETKRSPPIWSVKIGARYAAVFSGKGARAKAERRASKEGEYTVKEKPELQTERPAWKRRAS